MEYGDQRGENINVCDVERKSIGNGIGGNMRKRWNKFCLWVWVEWTYIKRRFVYWLLGRG
jgi:hypothetical protein